MLLTVRLTFFLAWWCLLFVAESWATSLLGSRVRLTAISGGATLHSALPLCIFPARWAFLTGVTPRTQPRVSERHMYRPPAQNKICGNEILAEVKPAVTRLPHRCHYRLASADGIASPQRRPRPLRDTIWNPSSSTTGARGLGSLGTSCGASSMLASSISCSHSTRKNVFVAQEIARSRRRSRQDCPGLLDPIPPPRRTISPASSSSSSSEELSCSSPACGCSEIRQGADPLHNLARTSFARPLLT